MRFLMGICLIMLLVSCTNSTENYYTPTVKSWRGAHLTTLLKTWGYPDKKINRQDQHTFYVYYTESNYHYPAPSSPGIGLNIGARGLPVVTTPNTNMTWNRGNKALVCLTIFEVLPNGKIIDTQIQGDQCYMNEKMAKKMSR